MLEDPFSRSFPCRTKAREVTQALPKEIIPRLGVPAGLSSDRGAHFVSEVRQRLSEQWGEGLGGTEGIGDRGIGVLGVRNNRENRNFQFP